MFQAIAATELKVVSRTLILFSILGVTMALLAITRIESPAVQDVVVRSIDAIFKAPFSLIFILTLLGFTMGAGAWAILIGIRAQGKRLRIGGRRRVRLTRL